MKGPPIPVRFGDAENEQLTTMSAKTGISKSELIRRAFRFLLDEVKRRDGKVGWIMEEERGYNPDTLQSFFAEEKKDDLASEVAELRSIVTKLVESDALRSAQQKKPQGVTARTAAPKATPATGSTRVSKTRYQTPEASDIGLVAEEPR